MRHRSAARLSEGLSLSLALLPLLAALAAAAQVPVPLHPDVVVLGRAEPQRAVPVRLHLRQRQLGRLEELVQRVSTPGDPLYQRYLSREEAEALVAPEPAAAERAEAWLRAAGAAEVRRFAAHLEASLSASQVEGAFRCAVYRVGDRGAPGERLLAAGGYTLPPELEGEVELVTGFTEAGPRRRLGLRGVPGPSQDDLVPATLAALYSLGGATASPAATQQVIEFTQDGYSARDMATFWKGAGAAGEPPAVALVGVNSSWAPDLEGALDVQLIAAVAPGANTSYWSLDGWLLDAAQDLMKLASPPLVNSMSWGSDERGEGADYNARVDAEFAKLALRGVTMVAASGDNGAAGTGQCTNKYPLNPAYPAASNYVLSVGATWLVSTSHQPPPSGVPPVCAGKDWTCAYNGTELPANSPDGGYATGGGFSVFNRRLAYQDAAVSAYLADASIPKPPASSFNASNRGFPDVAANGNNLLVFQGSTGWNPAGGTSAATPIWAGVVSLLNSHLAAAGKAPLGFVNPLLYQMAAEAPGTFTVVGDLSTNNRDGCKEGYVSNPLGWAPVTGLGTPNVARMLAYLDAHIDMFAAPSADRIANAY